MTRHWSINGRFLSQPLTGVQRHAQEIVLALDDLVAKKDPSVAGLSFDVLVPQNPLRTITLRSFPQVTVAGMGGHAWEQTALPRRINTGLLSLGNTGPLVIRRQIVCIHDANTRLQPDSYSRAFRWLYRGLHPALGRTAARIVTVSDFSSAQLVRLGIVDQKRITVIPNGYEHALRWPAQHTPVTRAHAGPSTIVLLGSLAPHKNIELILNLAPSLAAHGLKIAVVGSKDSKIFAAFDGSQHGDTVHWLGRLEDTALAALLRDSLCLAFPSLTEGFGLPPLEAMALGCPVVSSNAASLVEVCADAALYADPLDPAAWLARILELHASQQLQTTLVIKGRARAEAFSWSKSARLYAGLMQSI